MVPHAALISVSDEQRRPKPDLPWVATCAERARSVRLPVPAGTWRLPPLPGADDGRQGRAPRDRRRDRVRPAAQARRQVPRAPRAAVLRRARATAPLRPDRVRRRGDARREGRAAPACPRDALPDRVGRAVRARDDRVDGVRDAGDRDPLRRRAGGDRRRRDRRDRPDVARHGRRARTGRCDRPAGAATGRRGAVLAGAHGRRLRRGVRATIERWAARSATA